MIKENADTSEEFNEEIDSSPVLIRRYGEFWDPEGVNWKKLNTLLGCKNRNSKGDQVEITGLQGIYVLFKDYSPIYVGKAYRESLGSRLKKHWRSPRTRKRWDLFSWFEISPSSAGVSENDAAVIATIEALLIMVCAPRLNSRKEKLKGATLLYQIPVPPNESPESINSAQEIRSDIKKLSLQLNTLEKTLRRSK